jgi:hypothetical protein
VSPTADPLNFKVAPNWQPVLRGSVGENLNSVNALDTEQGRKLAVVERIDIRDRRLANDFQLQEMLEPQ